MANEKDFKVKKGLVVTENILAQGNIQLVDSLGNTLTLVDSSNNVIVAGSIIGPSTLTIDPAAIGDATGLVRILGNLQVDGTTTSINSTTLDVTDKNITLAKNAADAAAANGAGLTIDGASATLTYASTGDKFVFNKSVEASSFVGSVTGNIVGNVTGNVTGTVSDISNHSTTNLTEGTNLYYTTARADSAFDASFALASTDSLSEGSTNLYHTTARARSSISGDKGISYDNSTGVIDVDSTNITSIARGAVSAAGALTYNVATGQFSFVSGQSGLIDSSLAQGMIDSNFNNIDSLNVTGIITAGTVNAGTINATNITGDGSNITGAGADSGQVQSMIDSNLTNGRNVTLGNIIVSGTVDGRDVATDGTKLDGIANNATANPNAIDNIVEDTTPQLGGDLDLNSKNITGTGGIQISGNIELPDNYEVRFGTSQDLTLAHFSGNSEIRNRTGELQVRADTVKLKNNNNNATYLSGVNGGAVELYHNNNKKLETTNTGATVTGTITATAFSGDGSNLTGLNIVTDTSPQLGGDLASNGNNINIADTDLLQIGTGNDLQIYHQSNVSYLKATTTNPIRIQAPAGAYMANFQPAGSVDLYHSGSKKFETTSAGVTVTGDLDLSGNVDGRDIAADGTKLDGIDASATANPITGAGNDRIITSGGGKALTAEADFQFDGTNLFIPAEIRHLGDPDTKLGFTTDTITLTAGGTTAQTITATSTTIAGNLIVNGTTTTLNSTTLDVDDLNITVAKGAGSAAAANGAGLTVDGASATLLYQSTGDKWVFNKPLEATSFTGNVTSSTVDINGGAIDGTNIGATTPGTGAFTTVDINGGAIDGTNIGAATPGTGAFTTLTGNTVGGFSHLSAVGGGGTVDIVVTVASKTAAHRYNGTGSSLGYVLDGVSAPYLTLTPGRTYKFKQDDNSNSGHPFRFYYDAAKTTAYTTNVTTQGSGGSSGDYTQIVVDENTPPVLFYQCSAHGYMGNAIRTGTRNFTGLTTDNITEGSTNLYYTDARVDTRFDTRLATKSTTNLSEGTNLYYTNARADARIQAANLSDLNNVTGVPSTGQILSWNGSNWVPANDAGGLDSALTKQLIDSAHIGKINIGDLNNVSSAAPSSGQVLKWNGSAWAPAADATGGGGGGGSQNLFSTIAVAGQSDVVADATTDTLTLVAGSNMTITTNAGSDTITFASTGGGGGGSGTVDSAATITLIQSTVDSAYVQLRQTSGGGGGSGTVDSAATISLINAHSLDSGRATSLIDSNYVQSRMLGINSSKITEFKYVADSGQTVFSGNDANGNALAISSTNHEVYLNGIRLLNDDFSASPSANSITVAQGLDSADELVIVTQGSLTTNDRFVVGAGTQRFFFNADSGQTAFTGNDKHGNALTFDSGQVDVYLNGILLTNEDVIQNGTTNTITLTSAADSGDDLAVIAYNATLASEFTAGTGTLNTFKFTLSNSQTLIEGGDQKGNTLQYVPGNELVFLNGLLLQDSDDYVTTSTTVLTLTTGANANDELVIQDYASMFSGNTAGIINPEFKEFKYIADSGDTVFSGNDASGQALSLTSNNFEVFLNGIRLLKSDYVANTTANSITLQGFTAADSDEIIINTIVGNVRFNGAQAVSQIVDSAYVAARTAAGTDSASVISLINATVDDAYITRHSLDSSLALQLLLDSSEIIDLIDSAYVAARVGVAASANAVYVDESEDDNNAYNVIFQNTAGGGNNYQSMQVDNGGLTFNPGTNTLFVASQIVASSNLSEPTGGLLTLQSADTTINDGNNLGTIQFKASSEASGGDALSVAAEITAEADVTFSADSNATDLIFKLGTSGAATEKARLTHEGNFSAISFSGDGSGLTGISAIDSALTIQLIDSAYVNSKFDGTVDPKFTDFLFTVDSGTTVITGLSDDGDSLSIGANNFSVFLNGIKLQSTDFVDSSANNRITLNNALDSADEILVQTVTSTRTSASTAILETVDSAYIQQRLSEMVPATSTFSTFRYVSTEGQSVYTGNDANGVALSYDSAQVQVFLNGLLLTKTEDFTLQNKNQITLQDSVNSGSELVINNYATNFRSSASFGDSAAVTSMIDSAYVQIRATGGGVTYNATSSNITLEKGNAYIVDTSSARTLTLPATGTLGDEIKIIDGTGQAGTNNITINRNGHKIQGLTDNLVINVNRAAQGLVYYNAAQGWILSEN